MSNEQYVLEAKETIQRPFSDGYYIGKSYIYQGSRYAIVNSDITKAKVYTSQARAIKASEMEFENYEFRAIKFND